MERDYIFKRCLTLQCNQRIAFRKQWVVNGALQLIGRGFFFLKKMTEVPVHANKNWSMLRATSVSVNGDHCIHCS